MTIDAPARAAPSDREERVAESRSEIRTFLFTDIEGSTRLWERQPRAMAAALAEHDALLRAAIEAAGGAVFKTGGDAFYAVFPSPTAAIAAAVAAQRALTDAEPEMAAPLRVRMAIHAGDAEARDGDFFGPPLNRVARLLAVGHGQQILVSRAAGDLARDRLPADVALRDLGLHALKDLPQPERIFQLVAPGLAAAFPTLRTPDHLLRAVPRHPTPLIGREREIAIARDRFGLAADEPGTARAVEPPVRLLTLTGPGGAGKTRLALHLALTLGVEFADGAAFVSLAELTDPALAPVAIAGALDRDDGGADASGERLIERLRDRQMLLVLDNFEQVMGATATVAELLAGCPRLTILATSRERLNVRGEHELPLPPLALPAPAAGADDALGTAALAEIERADAVRLFVERAQSVKPGFALTADNATAVVEICRRLDGLPLAIELAAARTRLLSPPALLSRLDRRLDLLGGGSRDLPARQQTMRATIAWSYDLLDPLEQRRFARASIFAGGATLDAFAAIADDGDDPLAALDALAALADKSLLRLVDGDEARLAMLETIRDFGRERLAAWGDADEIGRRHAAFYLALAEAAEPELQRSGQTRALDRLEADRANLRAALDWLRDRGETDAGLRLGGALWRFWWLRGDVGEGRSQLEALLAQPATVAPEVRAKALNGAGVLADAQGDWEAAARLHQASLDLSRALGDARGVAWSLNNLGVVALNQGNYERAEALLQENLAVAEAAGDLPSIATAQLDLGQLALYQRDHDRATAALERGLTLFRQLGDESHVARTLNNLGYMALERGDYERAEALLSESLALHRSVGDRQGIAGTLNNLAEVATAVGDLEPAARLYLESHALALEGGNRLYAAIAMGNLAALARRRGEARLAQRRFREALLLYHAVGDGQGIAESLSGLASLAADDGAAGEAATLYGAVAAIAEGQREIEAPDIDAAVCMLREALDDDAFAIAWDRGRAAPLDEIVARAAGEIGLAASRPA